MLNGVINIYKEKGFTSFDVVAKLRGILHQKKIGHTGTLDPDAEGVLPVCLGKGTKVVDMLTDKDKTYRAVMLLGVTTDTQDITGTVLEEKNLLEHPVSEEQVRSVISGFIGTYDQIPPMYSALKVNGKKLYELARQGITVERKPRSITIHDIRILDVDLPRVTMEVDCQKGTYIRTLCHDIGQKLGTGACMESLLRTRVGQFGLEDAMKLHEVEQLQDVKQVVIPIDALFDYKKVTIKDAFRKLVYNGNPFPEEAVESSVSLKDKESCLVYVDEHTFVGIYHYRAERKDFKLDKMFLDKESEYADN